MHDRIMRSGITRDCKALLCSSLTHTRKQSYSKYPTNLDLGLGLFMFQFYGVSAFGPHSSDSMTKTRICAVAIIFLQNALR